MKEFQFTKLPNYTGLKILKKEEALDCIKEIQIAISGVPLAIALHCRQVGLLYIPLIRKIVFK